jgi:hypothetical protein
MELNDLIENNPGLFRGIAIIGRVTPWGNYINSS